MQRKPTLRFFDLTMIVVSMVIGIGIFRNPSIIAQYAGEEWIFYLAWVIGGIIALFGALTFAELGSRLPLTGGFYRTYAYCFPAPVAFTLIWTYLALDAGAASAVAYAGAQYITPVILPESLHQASGERLIFFGIIFLLFGINFLGLRAGSMVQNLLSVIKIGLMLLFCSALFFTAPTLDHIASETTHEHSHWLYALGTSLIAVFFTYGGYQNTTNLGGDVLNAQKNITRSIITGVVLVIALYLVINYVYVSTLGFDGVQQSPLIAADLASLLFGESGGTLASIAIFISILGWLNASLLFNPRVIFAMSEQGVLPGWFKQKNEKRQVQEVALVVFTMMIIFFFIILQTYENLLNYVMFNDTIVLACAVFCIFILRRKQKGTEYTGYRIHGYPWVPVIFIVVTLGVTLSVILDDPKNALIGFCVLLFGFPLYYLLQRWRGRAG